MCVYKHMYISLIPHPKLSENGLLQERGLLHQHGIPIQSQKRVALDIKIKREPE